MVYKSATLIFVHACYVAAFSNLVLLTSQYPAALQGLQRDLSTNGRFIGSIFTTAIDAALSSSASQDNFVSPEGHNQGKRSRQTLGQIFQSAKAKDFERFMASAASRYIQHSPDLPDGWKPVWDLLAERPKGFVNKSTNWLGPAGMLDNGDYLVMLREVKRGDAAPASKIVDIMLFDDEGKYAEHWDIRQTLAKQTASGRSETEAAKIFIDNPVNYSEEVEEANKKTAASFLQPAFNEGKLAEALDKYVAKDYVQHNPLIPDGVAAVKQAFEAGKIPKLKYDIQVILAQNDVVVVFSKVEAMGKLMAVVDLLRIRDDMLVEHWDVLQEVPAAIDMPHTNGMFLLPNKDQ